MKSIRKRLFVIFMLLMLILVAGNVIINICFIKDYYMRQNKKRMKNTGSEIQKMYYKDKGSLVDYIEMIEGTWGIWIRIADEDYNILYTSNAERNTNKILSSGTISVIGEGKSNLDKLGFCYSEVSKEDDKIVRLVYVIKFHDEDSDKYIVMTRSIQSVYENINTANQLVLLTALILLIIGFIFIFYFSKSITKPILEISKNAKEISKLNFNHKLTIKSDDEIGILAESINEISDKLSFSIDELKTDISDRKELVRNMSHELKTPISAIKGYTEGLKYAVADTPEKMNKYCDVIILECNKMDSLVKEILELSKMENINQSIEKTTFKPMMLIEGIEMCFGEQIKKQQINFSIVGDENFYIYGEYKLLERAAFNYIENALHYTNEKGIIIINLSRKDSGFLFRVYNSGNRIPKDELNNIWKVFYKTDKSRTRGSNNYGVGLSIVRATIELHSGKVNVINKDNGVEFSFWIPG